MEPTELVQTISGLMTQFKTGIDDELKKRDETISKLKQSLQTLEEKNGRAPSPRGSRGPSLGESFVQSQQFIQFKSLTVPRGRVTVHAVNPLLKEVKTLTPLLSPAGGAGSTFVGGAVANLGPVPGAL